MEVLGKEVGRDCEGVSGDLEEGRTQMRGTMLA